MDSADRLQWFVENVEFLTSLEDEHLPLQVPTCPGWSISDLVTHLSFGLGVCYPIAAATPPATSADLVFSNADRSSIGLMGLEAVESFRANLRNCVTALKEMDPAAPCWTYAGDGLVSFWIRRAACETAIHRYDAERALGEQSFLTADRADDGIDEVLEFAYPFAGRKIGAPPSRLRVVSTDSALRRSIGSGEVESLITCDAHSLFLAMWGREPDTKIHVDGDRAAADQWLTLPSRAFAGR